MYRIRKLELWPPFVLVYYKAAVPALKVFIVGALGIESVVSRP